MEIKSSLRFILATVVSAGVMFSLAGLYTGVIARDFIASHVDSTLLRAPPNLALVFVGYVVLAALMSGLYLKFGPFSSSRTWSGLRFGWLIAVLWLMPYSIVLFGVYRFPYAALPLDFAWALVEQGVGGVIIAFIMGQHKRST
jgi:hypothetical protein